MDERERNQREERERTPDVRLTPLKPSLPPPASNRLPTEANCFVIKQLLLKTTAAEKPRVAGQFAWVLIGVSRCFHASSALWRPTENTDQLRQLGNYQEAFT